VRSLIRQQSNPDSRMSDREPHLRGTTGIAMRGRWCGTGWQFRLDQGKQPYLPCENSALDSGVGNPLPTLAYGHAKSLGSITCDSEPTGMTCTDSSTVHFFRVSQQSTSSADNVVSRFAYLRKKPYRSFAITDEAVIFFFGEDQLLADNVGPIPSLSARTQLASLLA